MRWSLERALESDVGASVTALASIDNSEVANAVYLANYPDENASGVLMRRNIEHLSSVETLDARFGGADVWTLSPPCQPYTRKGSTYTAKTLARARSRGSSRPSRSYESRPTDPRRERSRL